MQFLLLFLLTLLIQIIAGSPIYSSNSKNHFLPLRNPKTLFQHSQLPQVGNGFIASFISSPVSYLAGVFNGQGTLSTRAGIPSTAVVYLQCVKNHSSSPSSTLDYSLDMHSAAVSLSGECQDISVNYAQRWYAHAAYRNVFVLDIFASSSKSAKTAAKVGNVSLSNLNPTDLSSSDFSGIQFVTSYLASESINVTVYQTKVAEEPNVFPVITIAVARTVVPSAISLTGEPTRILSSFVTSLESPDQTILEAMALKKLKDAMSLSAQDLYAEHTKVWAEKWKYSMAMTSSSSSAKLPKVIEASQYAIWSSVREDWPYSTSPGGLSTDGYNGHTFWDMETWMLPNLILFHPALAHGSGLLYRQLRMAGAENNAKQLNCTGAAFPWESALTGYDVCPWPQGANTEIHITADVIGAVRLYLRLTRNESFIREFWPVLLETANFWVSRVSFSKNSDAVHLNGVTPPDEYHFGNDSVYTNFAVKETIQYTLEVAKKLNITIPKEQFTLMQRIAYKMTILYDAKKNYHPEFEGYDGSTVKQADVVLLNYPWGMKMAESTIKNDLLYYENRTDPNGPAMTWSMFGVGYLSLGERETGLQYISKGWENNCFPPYYQWSEVAGGGGCPNFITGAGGFLQSIWAGLAGLRVVENERIRILSNSVTLPKNITNLYLRGIYFLGSRLSFHYQALGIRSIPQDDIEIEICLSEEGAVPLMVHGERFLKVGDCHRFNAYLMRKASQNIDIQAYTS